MSARRARRSPSRNGPRARRRESRQPKRGRPPRAAGGEPRARSSRRWRGWRRLDRMKQRDIATESRSASGRQNAARKRRRSEVAGQRARRGPTYAQTVSIELIVGPPTRAARRRSCAGFGRRSDRDPVLVVPTAGDVTAFERELSADAPTLGGSIATFDALAGEIASALGAGPAPELTVSQRQALVRAAIDSADPGRLRRSASRPGFAPALARMIAELEGALIAPADFAQDRRRPRRRGLRARARRLLLALRGAPRAQRPRRPGHDDRGRDRGAPRRPGRLGGRPVFVYGFDDLTRGAAGAPGRPVGGRAGDGRRDLRRPARAGAAGKARRGAARPGRRDRGEAPVRGRLHAQRHASTPRPRPVRAGRRTGRGRRRPRPARVGRGSRRGRGGRDRDRAPAALGLRARPDRDRLAPPGPGGPAPRGRSARDGDPGGTRVVGRPGCDPGRRRADRPLPRRDGRDRGRGTARPPAPRPDAGPRGGRHRRGAHPPRRGGHGDGGGRALGLSPAPSSAPARGRGRGAAAARAGAKRARAGRGRASRAAPRSRAAAPGGPASPSRRWSSARASPRPSCSRSSPALAALPGCEVPELAGAIEAIESSSVRSGAGRRRGAYAS